MINDEKKKKCTKCGKKVEHPLTTTTSTSIETGEIMMILCDECDKEFYKNQRK